MVDTRQLDAWSPVSRRQAIVGAGSLATGSTALLVFGTADARAAVEIRDWTVADAEFEAEDIEPAVDATVDWSYDVGSEAVGSLRLAVLVGGDVVAEQILSTDVTTASQSTDLSGPVAESNQWSVDAFAPSVGDTVEHTLDVGVEFAVRDSADGVLADASDSDTATVSVAHPQQSTLTAQVGGSATVVDSSD